jgi:hypothetical protein
MYIEHYWNTGWPTRYVLLPSLPKLPNAKLSNDLLSKFVKTINCRKPSCQTNYKISNILQNVEHITKCWTYYKKLNILQNVKQITKCWTYYKMLNILQNVEHITKCWTYYKMLNILQNVQHITKCRPNLGRLVAEQFLQFLRKRAGLVRALQFRSRDLF